MTPSTKILCLLGGSVVCVHDGDQVVSLSVRVRVGVRVRGDTHDGRARSRADSAARGARTVEGGLGGDDDWGVGLALDKMKIDRVVFVHWGIETIVWRNGDD
jgi:hypothetical protein